MSGWLYFGCRRGGGSGHYLTDADGRSVYDRRFELLDGKLCEPERDGLYLAVMRRLPNLGYSALAWWDRSVDTRPGSNSIILAPSSTCSLNSIRVGLAKWFPWVEARLPQPLVMHPFCCPHGIRAECTACEPLARLRYR